MQTDPACKHRFSCLYKAPLVGNINKLDFKCSQTLLCAVCCTMCVRPLTPDSTGVFLHFGRGSGNSGTGWHHSKPGMCHFSVWLCINYRYFHIYRYVGEYVPHTRARQQPGTHALHSTRHTPNHTHITTCAENDPPSLISLLEKFPTMRTGSNITAAKGLLHSQRILGCWGGVFFPSKKKSARKSSRIFFFLIQGYIKKQRLHGKDDNYSIARKDPELLTI